MKDERRKYRKRWMDKGWEYVKTKTELQERNGRKTEGEKFGSRLGRMSEIYTIETTMIMTLFGVACSTAYSNTVQLSPNLLKQSYQNTCLIIKLNGNKLISPFCLLIIFCCMYVTDS